jgi:hypothetical protein
LFGNGRRIIRGGWFVRDLVSEEISGKKTQNFEFQTHQFLRAVDLREDPNTTSKKRCLKRIENVSQATKMERGKKRKIDELLVRVEDTSKSWEVDLILFAHLIPCCQHYVEGYKVGTHLPILTSSRKSSKAQ